MVRGQGLGNATPINRRKVVSELRYGTGVRSTSHKKEGEERLGLRRKVARLKRGHARPRIPPVGVERPLPCLLCAADDLHVLLRHGPRSIPHKEALAGL